MKVNRLTLWLALVLRYQKFFLVYWTFLKIKIKNFRAILSSQHNWEGTESLYRTPIPNTCMTPAVISITHQDGIFLTVDELTLTHHNHSKSIVYLMVHSWCCAFYGFGQIYKYIYPSLQYPAKYFHCPKKSSVFCCSISYLLPTMSKHWSVHCFHSVYCLCCKVR